LSFFLFGQLLEFPFLVVCGFESPYYTLPSPLYFLNDPDGGFHIGVKSGSFLNDFFFREISLFKVDEELLDNLVAFGLVVVAVVDEVAGDVHLYLAGTHPHL
jgi:hypothetical protein